MHIISNIYTSHITITALCDILYKRLRNTLIYLLTITPSAFEVQLTVNGYNTVNAIYKLTYLVFFYLYSLFFNLV